MVCANCGSNIDEGTYCPVCGASVEVTAETGSEETALLNATDVVKVEKTQDKAPSEDKNKTNKKKRVLTPEEQAEKKKIITKLIVAGAFFVFGITMVCVAIIVGVLAINNPANKIIDSLENGYYYTAESLYVNSMKGKPNKKLVTELDKRIDIVWEDFQSRNMSYDDASAELLIIKGMGIDTFSDKLDKTISNVEKLQSSRVALENARESMEYDEAIGWYNLVIPEDPNYETAQEELAEVSAEYKEDVFGTLDEYMADEYFYSLFELLSEVKQTLPNDEEVNAKAAECEAAVISKAEGYIAEKKYDDAIDIINNALEGYPENETLNKKLTELETGRPTYLQDLNISLDSENYRYDADSFTDANGVEHYGSFLFDPGLVEEKTANAEFYLEKKYTKFTATFVPNSSTNEKEKFTIEILVDGKVVKTIKNFTIKSENEPVEIDVTGAQKLEIRVKSTDFANYNYISMVDASVFK